MSTLLSLDDISCLDRQIEQLNDYKPIPEHEVKALCDKVREQVIEGVNHSWSSITKRRGKGLMGFKHGRTYATRNFWRTCFPISFYQFQCETHNYYLYRQKRSSRMKPMCSQLDAQ